MDLFLGNLRACPEVRCFTGLSASSWALRRFPSPRRFKHFVANGFGFLGFSKSQARKCSEIKLSVTPLTSDDTSLSLVCEENFKTAALPK